MENYKHLQEVHIKCSGRREQGYIPGWRLEEHNICSGQERDIQGNDKDSIRCIQQALFCLSEV